MDLTALTGPQTPGTADGLQKSFREADFLAVMLTEITHQDPFQPTETAKMIEQMQQLQNLANSNYEKFRDDIRWAQDLVGQEVTATQSSMGADEAAILGERGVQVDVGFGSVTGMVETYRTVGENVWVSIDGKDYPIDNVQQISPPAGGDPERLAELSAGLLGRTVSWFSDTFTLEEGVVKDLRIAADGTIRLTAGDAELGLDQLRSVR